MSVRRESLHDVADTIAAQLDREDAARGGRLGHDVSGELRVLAGNGRESGRWTRGGGTAARTYPGGDPNDFLGTMEPAVRDMARRLQIDPAWLLGLSSYESGWLEDNKRAINSPFGMTKPRPGGTGPNDRVPIQFNSIEDSLRAWERTYGDWVRGSKSAAEFVHRLQDTTHHPAYNSEKRYKEPYEVRVLRNIRSVERRQAQRNQR
jgi:hypothetical protein